MVPLSYYLVLSAILFACGVAGFLIKRNIITIFLSIELMLNGVNLTFVAFAAQLKSLDGHIFVFFVMVVAAAEAAVGLAIIIAVFRTRETLNVDRVNLAEVVEGRFSLFAFRQRSLATSNRETDSMTGSRIDEAILSVVRARWMKVAMVLVKAADATGLGLANDDEHYEVISTRVEALVNDGRLSSAGRYEELACQ